MSVTQDQFDRAAITGLTVFAASVGVLSVAGLLLLLAQLVADTAQAVAAAAPAGVGVTIAIRKGSK
jgi:Na+/melibiose symporter-like transporter